MSGLKVVDDQTFTVELKQPESDWPLRLGYTAFVPVPSGALKDPKGFGEKLVGNGPYKLADGGWQHNVQIQLVPNPDYNGPRKAKNAGVTFKIYQNDDSAYQDLVAISAQSLQDLHQLHQRAKALRDRLTSGPKTLAARQAALANRQAALESARKADQDAKVQIKKREHLLQGHQAKIDDLKVKLNLAKKNDEYKAIQNQIAHDQSAMSKVEDEVLEAYGVIEAQASELAALEAETKKFAEEVEAFRAQIESQAGQQKAQLAELEAAIVGAEDIIPENVREQYRRLVKRHGADHGLHRERRLLGLLRLDHGADEERADQRPFDQFLHDLRPAPLHGRRRPPPDRAGRPARSGAIGIGSPVVRARMRSGGSLRNSLACAGLVMILDGLPDFEPTGRTTSPGPRKTEARGELSTPGSRGARHSRTARRAGCSPAKGRTPWAAG